MKHLNLSDGRKLLENCERESMERQGLENCQENMRFSIPVHRHFQVQEKQRVL